MFDIRCLWHAREQAIHAQYLVIDVITSAWTINDLSHIFIPDSDCYLHTANGFWYLTNFEGMITHTVTELA